jgi:ribosomal protein S18 acetylase RimI-like enzyme
MTTIRHAKSADIERIHELIVAIADHHNQSEFVLTDPGELLAAGFGNDPKFGVLLAEYDGSIVGYLSFTINYSIWLGNPYMNVDDVYIDSQCRGLGIGEALMREAKAHCQKLDISRVRWEVQKDNYNAIRFYKRLGAKFVEKGVFSWDLSQ